MWSSQRAVLCFPSYSLLGLSPHKLENPMGSSGLVREPSRSVMYFPTESEGFVKIDFSPKKILESVCQI
jgi:hypothetical protein